MRDRREKLLRIVCLVLGAVLAFQVALFAVHASFSRGLTIPALPSLPPQADEQAKATNSPPGKVAAKPGTNAPGTNASGKIDTNSPGTNSAAQSGKGKTNSIAAKGAETNATPSSTPPEVTNATAGKEPAGPQTNPVSAKVTGTNASNVIAVASSKDKTNALTKAASKKAAVPSGRPGAPGKAAELPPAVKDRVERIVQGEILAPVMRPMPMALLGIGGESALLRSPDGQTGVVKEGDQLGTLKLLRIGTNRVIVEQDGEKKELMIFAGLGSESLLSKPDTTTNEPPKKTP